MQPTINKHFDVLVIGGGVVGCAILRELARYRATIALLEGRPDICDATSKANSAILHTGFDAPPGTLEARLLAEARHLWPETIASLNLPYRKTGALMVATNEEEEAAIEQEIAPKAKKNDVALLPLNRAEVSERAPYVTSRALSGVLIEHESVVDPFATVYGHCEQAVRGGAEVFLGTVATGLTVRDSDVLVQTNRNRTFAATAVINAAGVWSDEVARLAGDESFQLTPRKGQFLVTKHDPGISHIILPVPNPLSKGILVTPTALGGVLLGPTAEDVSEKTDVAVTADGLAAIRTGVAKLVPTMLDVASVRQYAGVRAVSSSGDYIIRSSTVSPRLFHVAGIRSTGLSASPAIGRYVASLVAEQLRLPPKSTSLQVSPLPKAETQREEGDVVCLCKSITRSEILTALRKPNPPTTLDGLKRCTRALLGVCQGSICLPTLIELFQQQLGRDPLAPEKNAVGSTPIVGHAPHPMDTPSAPISIISKRAMQHVDELYDVAFIGMGLSTLSALQAGIRSLRTIILEHQSEPGGWLRFALPYMAFPEAESLVRTHRVIPPEVVTHFSATVTALHPATVPGEHHILIVRTREQTLQVRAQRVVLACGGWESTREQAQIPGSRPAGVITPLLVHQLLGRGYLPGHHAVIYGTGLYVDATIQRLNAAGVGVEKIAPHHHASEEETVIEEVIGSPRLERIRLRQGDYSFKRSADMLVYAAGMNAHSEWLRGSGIRLKPDGAIQVDERYHTNLQGVYAIGTVVQPSLDHLHSISMGKEVASILQDDMNG